MPRAATLLVANNFPAGRIEEDLAAVCAVVVSVVVVEIEHSHKRSAGQYVERLRVPDRPQAPVVLYKAQDGGHIVEAVVHVVPLGIGRNEQKREPHAKSTAILNGYHDARARIAARAGSKSRDCPKSRRWPDPARNSR